MKNMASDENNVNDIHIFSGVLRGGIGREIQRGWHLALRALIVFPVPPSLYLSALLQF